jgi:Dipeptidyl aminopeptidases/acylaminoacyl-peptidases
MKRIFLTILMIAAAFPSVAQKKHFTDRQLLDGLGENIVKMTAMPTTYAGSNLVYYQNGKQYSFDPSTGNITNYYGPVKASEPAIKEMVPGWQNPTYSPDKSKIAYTLGGDLYSIDVASQKVTRHTYDGSDLILNGYASWVYYEEILGRPSRYKAFWWSPDSKVLAFYHFDNNGVPMFPIYNSVGQHGSLNQTRYPKAGDENPKVKIGFVSAAGGEVVWADFDQDKDQYFGIPFWSGDGKRFMVAWMTRSQDDLILYSVNPIDGQKASVYTEHQNSWIDWMEEMLFTQEGIYIVRDFTGWQQVYFLSYDGKKFEQLTTGENWSVSLLKVDKKYLFFSAKRDSHIRTDIYRITLKSKTTEKVTDGEYFWQSPVISEDGLNVAALASNGRTPFRLVNISIPKSGNMAKKKTTVVFDTKGVDFDKYEIALPEIINLKMRDGKTIPASVIWPIGMDKNKRYPVKVNIYGGPDNPQVADRWNALQKQWWANHGVIQITLDNRAGGCYYGKKGLEEVYRYIGLKEIEDFIDGIKYFRALPYVNEDKIGIEGFSFGGTMTTLCVTEGSDYFKYGIAGGGVYDWALYDSHYTERYMDRPQDNPDGYAKTRVIDRVGNYKGDKTNMLRLTHGTGDDNVHFQNTLQLVDQLQKDCKNFELMIYPQGMHGYRGMQGQHSSMQDYIFWYRYLLDSDLPEVMKEYFSK